MENCLFDGKRICAYETKNKYGIYEFDKVEALKLNGDLRKLICEECGSTVYLKAGNYKVPHFAHHADQKRECYYEQVRESEEHRAGKFLLYQYMKGLYPDADIQPSYKFPNRRWADILVTFADGRRLVIEYQRKDARASEWKERHEHYVSNGIPDVWVLSAVEYGKQKDRHHNKVKFFEELVLQRGQGEQLCFLDTEKQHFTLVRLMKYLDESGVVKAKELCSRSYPLENVVISPEGKIICDFDNLYMDRFEAFTAKKRQEEEELKRIREEEVRRRFEFLQNLQENRQTHTSQSEEISPINPGENNFPKKEKPFDILQKEALEYKKLSPEGPWYDSTRDDKWGTCTKCGEFTKYWYFFSNKDNTCECKNCK